MDKMQLNSDQLMHQAKETANSYLITAIQKLDKQFGDGYAQRNPDLVSGFIIACSLDFGASIITSALQDFSTDQY
jgi:hypothetical protein